MGFKVWLKKKVFSLRKDSVYFLFKQIKKEGVTPGHLTKIKEFITEVQKAALMPI